MPRGACCWCAASILRSRADYALPGGFVEVGETVEDACRRELMEETGVKAGRLQLLGVYSDPGATRAGTPARSYFSRGCGGATPNAGDDAAAAEWVEDWSKVELAFDHAKILADAKRMLRKSCR